MRRPLASLAVLAALTGSAAAADCWPNAAGTQANCGAVQMFNNPSGQSVPVTAAAPFPVTIISGGSGGGAMTVADGADVAEGATTDAAATAGGTGTLSAKLRLLTTQFNTLNTTVATSAKQDTGNTSLGSIDTKLTSQATAANQSSQITQETAINTLLGLQADAACATDNGTCTLAALVKRLNQRVTTAIAGTAVTLPTTPLVASGNGVVRVPTSEASAGITPVVSGAAETGHVICAAACNLSSLTVTIGATAGYAMLFDATAVPSNGAVTPKWCYPINSNGTLGGVDKDWDPPMRLATGASIAFSSTGCFTLTLATASFIGGNAK